MKTPLKSISNAININNYEFDPWTKVLLHFEESVTKDECGNSWSVYGSPILSKNNSKFGTSIYLNGQSYIMGNLDGSFLNNNFTIDFWIYFNSRSNGSMIASSIADQQGFTLIAWENTIRISSRYNNLWHDDIFIKPIPLKELMHIAIVRLNNSIFCFKNGELLKELRVAKLIGLDNQICIGYWYRYFGYLNAFIDEFRISTCARWINNFIPFDYPYNTKNYKVIRFQPNGGEELTENIRKIKPGDCIGNLPLATKKDYILVGWFTEQINGKRIKASDIMPENDLVLYAQYELVINNFIYTGSYQVYTTPNANIKYKIECWGARGGYKSIIINEDNSFNISCDEYRENNFCFGGYTSGNISFSSKTNLFIYIGEAGFNRNKTTFNGGGSGGVGGSKNYSGFSKGTEKLPYIGNSGGGATDIRIKCGEWDDFESLKTRIMVAAGGGGAADYIDGKTDCCAGGLIGYAGTYYLGHGHEIKREGMGGNQISGGLGGKGGDCFGYTNPGDFGIGGNGSLEKASYHSGAGGGGGSGCQTIAGGYGHGGGGGSSFISGHEGCIAINADNSTKDNIIHTGTSILTYSKKSYIFSETQMIDGKGYQWKKQKDSVINMPNPNGGYYDKGKGNIGNGYARITILSVNINE